MSQDLDINNEERKRHDFKARSPQMNDEDRDFMERMKQKYLKNDENNEQLLSPLS